MKFITTQGKLALEYIRNTGGAVTVENFDEDHEPIGPLLRADLADYIEVTIGEKSRSVSKTGNEVIRLNKEGKKAINP